MIKLLEKYSLISWIFVIIIAITIFYISSLTFESLGGKGFGWKTVAYHFTAFFFLAFFLLPALARGKSKNLVFLGILLAILYGISDEIHQFFVPGRACTFSDLMVNSSGILLSSFIYTVSLRYRKNKKKRLYKPKPLSLLS